MNIGLICGGAFVIVLILLTMCIVAKWADEDMLRMMEQREKERKDNEQFL